jgi:two-component sensor histidine kinase
MDSRLHLHSRLVWAASAALASLGGLLACLLLIFDLVAEGHDGVAHSHEVRSAIERTMLALATVEAAHLRFLVWEAPEALVPYADAKVKALDAVVRLEGAMGGTTDRGAGAARLRSLVEARIQDMDGLVRLEEAGREEEVEALLASGDRARMAEEARREAAALQAAEDRLLSGRGQEVERLRFWFIAAGIGLAAALAALLVAAFAQALRAARHERAALRRLEAAVAERDALLREMNHRVGNGLMMVSTLIEMQARSAAAAPLAEELLRARDRVAAVGQVHRRLQRSEAIASIEALEYLRALCEDLGATMTTEGGRIEVDGDPATLPVETVVVLGLVVNELVTNAVRHAYGDRAGGRVEVRFTKAGNGLCLCVRDWGKGLPEGFEPSASRGIGMSVAHALAGQLAGEISFRSGGGTTVALTFPAGA